MIQQLVMVNFSFNQQTRCLETCNMSICYIQNASGYFMQFTDRDCWNVNMNTDWIQTITSLLEPFDTEGWLILSLYSQSTRTTWPISEISQTSVLGSDSHLSSGMLWQRSIERRWLYLQSEFTFIQVLIDKELLCEVIVVLSSSAAAKSHTDGFH